MLVNTFSETETLGNSFVIHPSLKFPFYPSGVDSGNFPGVGFRDAAFVSTSCLIHPVFLFLSKNNAPLGVIQPGFFPYFLSNEFFVCFVKLSGIGKVIGFR